MGRAQNKTVVDDANRRGGIADKFADATAPHQRHRTAGQSAVSHASDTGGDEASKFDDVFGAGRGTGNLISSPLGELQSLLSADASLRDADGSRWLWRMAREVPDGLYETSDGKAALSQLCSVAVEQQQAGELMRLLSGMGSKCRRQVDALLGDVIANTTHVPDLQQLLETLTGTDQTVPRESLPLSRTTLSRRVTAYAEANSDATGMFKRLLDNICDTPNEHEAEFDGICHTAGWYMAPAALTAVAASPVNKDRFSAYTDHQVWKLADRFDAEHNLGGWFQAVAANADNNELAPVATQLLKRIRDGEHLPIEEALECLDVPGVWHGGSSNLSVETARAFERRLMRRAKEQNPDAQEIKPLLDTLLHMSPERLQPLDHQELVRTTIDQTAKLAGLRAEDTARVVGLPDAQEVAVKMQEHVARGLVEAFDKPKADRRVELVESAWKNSLAGELANHAVKHPKEALAGALASVGGTLNPNRRTNPLRTLRSNRKVAAVMTAPDWTYVYMRAVLRYSWFTMFSNLGPKTTLMMEGHKYLAERLEDVEGRTRRPEVA